MVARLNEPFARPAGLPLPGWKRATPPVGAASSAMPTYHGGPMVGNRRESGVEQRGREGGGKSVEQTVERLRCRFSAASKRSARQC